MSETALFIALICLSITILAGITCVYCYWHLRRKRFINYALMHNMSYFNDKNKTDILKNTYFELLPLPSHLQNLLVDAESSLFIFDAFSKADKQKPNFEGTFIALRTEHQHHFKVYPSEGNEYRGVKLNQHLRFEGENEAEFIRFWQLLAIDFTGLSWEIEQHKGFILAHIRNSRSFFGVTYPLGVKHFAHLSNLLVNFNDLLNKELA